MSDFLSIDDLIIKTEKRLSEVPGTSTQLYAEDIIAEHLIEGFEFCAEKRWWSHLMQWYPVTLDGVAGIPNADFNPTIDKFKNIRAVFASDRNRPLPILSSTINPFLITGSRALYVEPFSGPPNRLFRVWPLTSTNTLYVHARLIPSSADYKDQTTILKFEPDILANYAAWMVATDEGTNPGQINTFEQRFLQLLSEENSKANEMPIILDTSGPIDPVDTWFVRP